MLPTFCPCPEVSQKQTLGLLQRLTLSWDTESVTRPTAVELNMCPGGGGGSQV